MNKYVILGVSLINEYGVLEGEYSVDLPPHINTRDGEEDAVQSVVNEVYESFGAYDKAIIDILSIEEW